MPLLSLLAVVIYLPTLFIGAILVYIAFRRMRRLKQDLSEQIRKLEINNSSIKRQLKNIQQEIADINATKSDNSNLPTQEKLSNKTLETKSLANEKDTKPILSQSKSEKLANALSSSNIKIPEQKKNKPDELDGLISGIADTPPKLVIEKAEKINKIKEEATLTNANSQTPPPIKTHETQEEKPNSSEQISPPMPPLPPTPPIVPTWSDRFQNFISNVDWEQFTGAKLFAWLGGIALFVGAGFFVKYSIDKNLISPVLRLVIGAIIGIAMIASSFKFERGRYDIMRQTLTSGGIGVLYSVFFAATLYYEYIPKPLGFLSLVIVSAAAFVLALFHKGITISILGAIGAYLTPLLVNTGDGSILSLFLYLAIVNIGLYQIMKRLESSALLLFSVVGTAASLIAASFFTNPQPEALVLALVWSLYLGLFSVFIDRLKFNAEEDQGSSWATTVLFLLMPLLALFLKGSAPPITLLAASMVMAVILTFRTPALNGKFIPYAAITFIVAIIWVVIRSQTSVSPWTYISIFTYGLAGGLGPVLIIYRHGLRKKYLEWFRVFPIAIALLGLTAIIIKPNISLIFWPMTIGLQLVGISISLLFGAIIQVGALSFILLIAALIFVNSMAPIAFTASLYGFILLAGFLILLVTFYVLKNLTPLLEKLNIDKTDIREIKPGSELTQWMAASPIMGVFFLLAATFLKGSPLNPHPGMFTLLCFLAIALTLTKKLNFQNMGVVTLFSAAFSQAFWMLNAKLTPELYFSSIIWSGLLIIIALATPFIVFKNYEKWKKLWMGWAIFEVAQALFFIFAADHLWSRSIAGWIPIAFTLIKLPIVSILLKQLDKKPERNAIIACHGGVMLAYVSAIPILLLQTGWLGLALVLEAVALLWLNRKVEHKGLRIVSSIMAPMGLYLLVSFMPQMKGPESVIIFNSAVMSMLLAVAALAAATKLSAYPEEYLGKFPIVKFFQWLAFGSGFFLINLIIADVFAGSNVASGSTLSFLPGHNLLHQIAYMALWSLFGAALWRSKKLPFPMRICGMVLLIIATFWLIIFPFHHGHAVAAMAPVVNLGLLAYLPIMLILLYLFLKEPWGDRYLTVKNLFLAMLLGVGFLGLKLVKATIFQPGCPLDLLQEKTASMAIASAAGWIIYGLLMLMWRKRLDKPFRIAGLALALLGIAKTISFPFRYATDFGAMSSIINRPTALFAFCIVVLIWLTMRKQDNSWPANYKSNAFWGVTLAITSFVILNIEIASVFGSKGHAFTLLTKGHLSHQLGYSLGWLVYAITLLTVGIKWNIVRVRQASLILIIVTCLKIFLKDLWSLGQLYRVASFIGLAFVMMLVSYLYQRFLSKSEDKQNEK